MPSAKGLFKSNNLSGTLINQMTKKIKKLWVYVLEGVGLTPNDVEKLDTISYLSLVKAGSQAVSKISGQETGFTNNVWFAPSADGEFCCNNLLVGFADISRNTCYDWNNFK